MATNRSPEETTILADVLLQLHPLMGESADIAALKQVIAKLDVKLEQVMIEAAIFEVSPNNGLNSGLIGYIVKQLEQAAGFNAPTLLSTTNTIPGIAAGALTYYQIYLISIQRLPLASLPMIAMFDSL